MVVSTLCVCALISTHTEKESQVAIETEHYQKQAQQLREKVQDLQTQLQQTKVITVVCHEGRQVICQILESGCYTQMENHRIS